MMKKAIILLLFLLEILELSAQEQKYFDHKRFSIYQGYRNIQGTKHLDEKQLDFLNYLYSQEETSDYQYFEMSALLTHRNKFDVDLRMALYNNLIPYCYNVAFNYHLSSNFGISAGSLGNRYYLTEFNNYYTSIFAQNISSRYIQRQWNISLVGFYIGPSFQYSYETLHLDVKLRGGMASFYPFSQKNIIKEAQHNFKMVLDYQTMYHFLPFVMPEIELSLDFIQYKNAIIGGRIKYAFLYTKCAVKYELTTYEWTYDDPVKEQILLSNHSFIQSDIDFGIFVKW